MEKRRHWWNSRWGRLSRCEVLMFEDGGVWWVEIREGGMEGRSRWFELPNGDTALDCARDMITASGFEDGWTEFPVG
jgi:hypothetical protein